MSPELTKTSNELVTEALRFLELGDVPIPLYLGTKRPCLEWKPFVDTPPSKEQVCQWFDGNDVNLGVLLRGNHFVRDFDDPESYEQWVRNHPLDATTLPTVET